MWHGSLISLALSTGCQWYVPEHARSSGGAGRHPQVADKEGGEGEWTAEEWHHSPDACCWQGNMTSQPYILLFTVMLYRSFFRIDISAPSLRQSKYWTTWWNTATLCLEFKKVNTLAFKSLECDNMSVLLFQLVELPQSGLKPIDAGLKWKTLVVHISTFYSFLTHFFYFIISVFSQNFLTTVAILLEAGSYVNAQTLGGETALMRVMVKFTHKLTEKTWSSKWSWQLCWTTMNATWMWYIIPTIVSHYSN